MHYALRHEHRESCLTACLLKGISLENKVELLKMQEDHGCTPIHMAVRYGHVGNIKCLFTNLGLSVEQKIELLKIQDKCGQTTVNDAARQRRSTYLIKSLLDGILEEQRACILKIRDEEGYTVIHLAAVVYECAETVKCLLDGISLGQRVALLKMQHRKDNGETEMHKVIMCSNSDVIRCLLDSIPNDKMVNLLGVQNDDGSTSISRAVTLGRADNIKYVFDSAGMSTCQRASLLEVSNIEGETAIHLAVKYEARAILESLLDGLSVEQKTDLLKLQDNEGNTVLHNAVNNGDGEILEYLLRELLPQQKVDILELENAYGCTALYEAASKKYAIITKYMLDGISVGQRVELLKMQEAYGNTAIHCASFHGCPDTIDIFFDCMPQKDIVNVLEILDEGGATPIHDAALWGHTDVVKCLLSKVSAEHKARLLEIADDNGRTPIHHAAGGGHIEMIKCLLDGLSADQKVDLLKIQDRDNSTAMHRAAWRGATEMMRYINEQMELLQAPDVERDMVLISAASFMRDQVVNYIDECKRRVEEIVTTLTQGIAHLTDLDLIDLGVAPSPLSNVQSISNAMGNYPQLSSKHQPPSPQTQNLSQQSLNLSKIQQPQLKTSMAKQTYSRIPSASFLLENCLSLPSTSPWSANQQPATSLHKSSPQDSNNVPTELFINSSIATDVTDRAAYDLWSRGSPERMEYGLGLSPFAQCLDTDTGLIPAAVYEIPPESTSSITVTDLPPNKLLNESSKESPGQHHLSAQHVKASAAMTADLEPAQGILPVTYAQGATPAFGILSENTITSRDRVRSSGTSNNQVDAVGSLHKHQLESNDNVMELLPVSVDVMSPESMVTETGTHIPQKRPSPLDQCSSSSHSSKIPRLQSSVADGTIIVNVRGRRLLFPFEDQMTVKEFVTSVKEECGDNLDCSVQGRDSSTCASSIKLGKLKAPFSVVVDGTKTVVTEIFQDGKPNSGECLDEPPIPVMQPLNIDTAESNNTNIRHKFRHVETPELAIELMEYVHQEVSSKRAKSIAAALKPLGKCRKTIDRSRFIYYLSVVNREKLEEMLLGYA